MILGEINERLELTVRIIQHTIHIIYLYILVFVYCIWKQITRYYIKASAILQIHFRIHIANFILARIIKRLTSSSSMDMHYNSREPMIQLNILNMLDAIIFQSDTNFFI